MEWSKEKTLKLIELLQVNANIWNTTFCDTRRDKQKRKEELRLISDVLGIAIPDITKKIQHLRTQYNRESAREARALILADDPDNRYISNWYAFEYLHFLKGSNKPYTVLHSEETHEESECIKHSTSSIGDCKIDLTPLQQKSRNDTSNIKPEIISINPSSPKNRDEFAVFGEYIANELRSLKGEKNLLVAKKKIQDVIFEVKMGMICDPRPESTTCTAYSHNTSILHSGKIYTTPVMSTTAHIEPLTAAHTPPTSAIGEIIINDGCHYTNFKVDSQ